MEDSVRWLVFISLCQVVQMFMSYDGGATPANIDGIKAQAGLQWTQTELGLLGSLDKFGMTVSSILWGRVLQLAPAKVLLVGGLFTNFASTLAFGVVKSKTVMFAAKTLMGVTQGLQCVWSTCWILSHAPPNLRTSWLGFQGVSAGLGNGIGTAIAGFGTSLGLTYSFAWKVEAGVLSLLWMALLFFNTDAVAIERSQEEEDLSQFGEEKPSLSREITPVVSPGVDMDLQPRASDGSLVSDFKFPIRRKTWAGMLEEQTPSREKVLNRHRVQTDMPNRLRPKNNRRASMQAAQEEFGEAQMLAMPARNMTPTVALVTEVEEDALRAVRRLLTHQRFIGAIMTLSSIMFTLSGITFLWVRVFMNAWGISKSLAVTGSLLSSGVGGALGVIVGPKAIDACGGFLDDGGRRASLKFICAMISVSLLAVLVSYAAMWIKWGDGTLDIKDDMPDLSGDPKMYVIWISVICVFSCFNACMAGVTGICVSAAPEDMWTLSSGITVSLQNLMGYAMGPLLPGIVMDALRSSFRLSDTRCLCVGFLVTLSGTLSVFAFSLFTLSRATWKRQEDLSPKYKPLRG